MWRLLLKHKNKKKVARGFSLVEALVSILILGITVGAMLGVFMIGKVSVIKARHYIDAINHARAAMEQYINNETIYTLPDGDEIKNLDGDCVVDSIFHATDLKRIEVTISWNELSMGGSRRVSEQLVTLIKE